jgi:succinate dehydrogenase flavin-adding protein (antitoxin of CptAB toxin-antitoxin module)
VKDDRELQRLKWRSRRGLLELDIVFERFWASGGSTDLKAMEELLELPDNDLLDLVMGRTQGADERLREVVARLRAA